MFVIVCARFERCSCVLFVLYCVLCHVFVCDCLNAFLLFVLYCAMLSGLGVVECLVYVCVCFLGVYFVQDLLCGVVCMFELLLKFALAET